GCMQKLFSQELRFKDDNGNAFPDWDTVPLNKLAGRTTLKNKDCKIVRVLTNSATKGVVSQTDYFDHEIANQTNIGGYYVVDIDSFVYNPRVSSSAPVGPIKRNKQEKGIMSPLYTVFKFKCGNIDFYEQYFESAFWHSYMHSVSNIGARHDRMNISTEDFLSLPLPLPNPEEQEKIANFLLAIDDKVALVTAELAHAKTFKKGLLQQMFV
ncbi:MAG: restriction endonuclease subunit S, partial [Pseudomonadota bacterium]|nr:restriction endonuclease subunit S [Pseudomonadota bacterium]